MKLTTCRLFSLPRLRGRVTEEATPTAKTRGGGPLAYPSPQAGEGVAGARRCRNRSEYLVARGGLAALAAALALGFLTPSAHAQSVENFYRGRTVTIVVGFGVGGGYDIHGRVLARHLGKHIPGNPTVIAQNMVGAGSLRAANFLYSAAPKDGTTSVCSRAAWRWSR